MRLSFGYWLLALLCSSFLIGGGLLVFVYQAGPRPQIPASQVVMTLRSSDSLFPPVPERLPPPAPRPAPASATGISKAVQAAAPTSNVEPIAPVPPNKERQPETKSEARTKPKREPKPEPKPEPESTLAPRSEPVPPSTPVSPAAEPFVSALPGRNTTSTAIPARPPVSLSAEDREAYGKRLVSHLTAAKRYPKRAQRRRIQGDVTLSFVINKQGKVLQKQIEQSSGVAILDQAALSMIDRASPVPVPPPGYGDAPYSFSIPVSFSLR